MKNRKQYLFQPTRQNVKQIGDGTVTCVFATMNTIDKDGDVTIPGAFGSQRAKIVGAHDWQMPSLGYADIKEIGDEAIAQLKFYTDMATASEWFTSLKHNYENGVDQQYSYGFEIRDSSQGVFEERPVRFLKQLKVFEISPVMLGAGIHTRTLAAKRAKPMPMPMTDESRQDFMSRCMGDDMMMSDYPETDQRAAVCMRQWSDSGKGAKGGAIGTHSTATDEGAWDGPANEKRVKSGQNAAYYAAIYAWRDPEGDPTQKSSYRFIHHEVDAEGTPGAANMKACVSAIGVLNGGRGVDYESQPWSGDRQGIYRHLAKHLRDGDMEPPALKSIGDEPGLTLIEEFSMVDLSITDVKCFLERERALAALRRKEGRVLSRANRDRLSTLRTGLIPMRDSISGVIEEIEKLLTETDPATDDGKSANDLQLLEIRRLESAARFRGRTAQ